MAGFSKVRLFYFVGLLDKRYDFQNNNFENSLLLRLNFYLTILAKVWFTIKFFLSSKFPKTSIIQLYIGKLLIC